MSREVPENIGELSTYALQQAIDRVDEALKDAPQDLRDAVTVIRLVENVPRQSPWYGVSTWAGRDDDQTALLGTLLGNIADTLEYVAGSVERPETAANAIACAHSDAGHLRRMLARAKRAYDAYLDHLLDPQQWEENQKRRRIDGERAAKIHQAATAYRGESR